ncbi:MAG: cob(I)yrinic acid a,c-diamide adenosyltransferase [Bacteriovoracaceae bacterium]|nr:cob(I)yrinic acid a,c-diamide adenosyltransferase [Bacteriovoracaceae bacterium]
MVEKSNIYTKMGDNGETGLVGGTRISKADARIDLYGEVDELNSWIGIAIVNLAEGPFKDEVTYLKKIQCYLFDLGSNLACEADQRENFKLPKLNKSVIEELEKTIDDLDSKNPKLTTFILPGGSRSSASLHLCRTVCRKIERKMIQFGINHKEDLPVHAAPFMNRLSDFFFVIARSVNVRMGIKEEPWKP